LRMPLLQGAARISYALYLLHPLFLSLVFLLAKRPEAIATVSHVGFALLALGVTLARVLCVLSVDRNAGHQLRPYASL